MRKALKEYLPSVLLDTFEFPTICNAAQTEFNEQASAVEAVLNASFVSLADENGIARYEKIFGVAPQDTDTLDERRFRVLSKINAQLPFSVRRLKQQLATLCGERGYELLLIPEQYTLEVKVELTAKRNLNAVEDLLRDIVPANLIQKCTLLYNQHQIIAKLTYAQMAKYLHQQLREEVLLNG